MIRFGCFFRCIVNIIYLIFYFEICFVSLLFIVIVINVLILDRDLVIYVGFDELKIFLKYLVVMDIKFFLYFI